MNKASVFTKDNFVIDVEELEECTIPIKKLESNIAFLYKDGIWRERYIGLDANILYHEIRNFIFEYRKQRDKSMLGGIKEYFKKHEETFITIIILILVDEYIFEGKFKDKINSLVDRFIDRTHKALECGDKSNV